MIRSALLAALPGLVHAHSTREDGPVGGRHVPGACEGRDRLARAAGVEPSSLVVPEQVHLARVARVGVGEAGRGHGRGPALPATDGLVTTERGLALFAQGADCPLVALAARDGGLAAVVHSGWRGTVARIAEEAVRCAERAGHAPAELAAAVFPGIGPCCYEVGPEVVRAFEAAFGGASSAWFRPARPDRALLDLHAAIVHTLTGAGVPPESIDVVRGCTACDGRLWSHRASGGGPERHGLVVALVAS